MVYTTGCQMRMQVSMGIDYDDWGPDVLPSSPVPAGGFDSLFFPSKLWRGLGERPWLSWDPTELTEIKFQSFGRKDLQRQVAVDQRFVQPCYKLSLRSNCPARANISWVLSCSLFSLLPVTITLENKGSHALEQNRYLTVPLPLYWDLTGQREAPH